MQTPKQQVLIVQLPQDNNSYQLSPDQFFISSVQIHIDREIERVKYCWEQKESPGTRLEAGVFRPLTSSKP